MYAWMHKITVNALLESPFSVGTHKSQIFISYKIFINVFWTNQIKLLQVSLFPMNGIMSHFVGNWFLCKIQIQVVFSGTTMYLQFWSTEVGEGRQHFKVYYFDSNRAFTVILCIQAVRHYTIHGKQGYLKQFNLISPEDIYENFVRNENLTFVSPNWKWWVQDSFRRVARISEKYKTILYKRSFSLSSYSVSFNNEIFRSLSSDWRPYPTDYFNVHLQFFFYFCKYINYWSVVLLSCLQQ
jgi:hypothetical protein